MSEPAVDEFSFLPAQAAELGVRLLPASRATWTAPSGAAISALRFGADGDNDDDGDDDDDDGPNVTFLHGAGLNAHTFDRTVLALAGASLSVDLPGHGDSSWRDDADYSPRTLAADLIPALRTWVRRPQVLVGQSLGGLTAAAVAASAPDLVRALVIVDIAPGIDPSGGPRQIREFFAGPTDWASRDELVDRALSFGLGGDRASAERGVFLNSRVRADGRVEWKHHFARIANALAADPGAATAAAERQDALTAVLAASGWDDLAAAAAPITLVRGERGFVTDTDAAAFVARLPRASVVTVPSGHNVQEELPERLADIIRNIGNKTDA